ncbi:MAG: HD-GYP domain-containing protein [Candidatus Omnitrophota bacterium]
MAALEREKSIYYSPSDADEFPLPSTPESHLYIPVDPGFLSVDKMASFPIYVYHPGRERFVLFKNEESAIKQEQLAMLSKGGRKPVFVPKTSSYELNEYLSQDLSAIVDDPNLPVKEKTQKFHAIASTVMQSLFDSPPDMKMFVATAKNISDSMARLVVGDSKSILELNLLRSYDYYTYSHSMNVCVLSLGLYMDLTPGAASADLHDLSRGLLLHDVGKCDIPNELTNKRGPLNKDEWEVMRSHPVKGFDRLEADDSLSSESRLISLHHHESADGSGYPAKMKHEQIPLTTRICKVVDVYDALTSRRSYKDGMPPFNALNLMMKEMKREFDQDILKAFILFLRKMGKLTDQGF